MSMTDPPAAASGPAAPDRAPDPGPDKVPNHWLRAIAAAPEAAGLRAALEHAAGLPSGALDLPGALIPRGAEADALGFLAARTARPFLGAEIGMRVDPRNSSILTYILFNSPDLGHALGNLARFMQVARPTADFRVEPQRDGGLRLLLGGGAPHAARAPHFSEFAVGLLLSSLRAAAGAAPPVQAVTLATDRADGAEELSRIFGCPVLLGAARSTVRFAPAALDMPVRDADAGLLGHLTGYCELLLARRPSAPAGLADQVRGALMHGMADGPAGLDAVAARLGMSARTLSRRLAAEGASFRALQAEARQRLARAFLADPGLTLAEIALLCGYSDQSAFTAAWRRRTGRTPRAERRALLAAVAAAQ